MSLPARYPPANEVVTIVAWRCEQCRKLQPIAIESVIVHIDEINAAWGGTTVKRHTRFTRRMVVCPPCRRSIADQSGQSNVGEQQ